MSFTCNNAAFVSVQQLSLFGVVLLIVHNVKWLALGYVIVLGTLSGIAGLLWILDIIIFRLWEGEEQTQIERKKTPLARSNR